MSKQNFLQLDRFPVIETPRLVLREIEEGDYDRFFELFKDEQVNEQIQLNWSEPTEARKFFESFKNSFAEGKAIRWSIVLRESGEWVGNLGFRSYRPEERCVERGLQILSAHWRRGYGIEASQAAMDWLAANTPCERVDAYTATGNIPAIALIERQGFRATGKEQPFGSLTLKHFLCELKK